MMVRSQLEPPSMIFVLSLLRPYSWAGVEVNKRGQVVVDMHTYKTSAPGEESGGGELEMIVHLHIARCTRYCVIFNHRVPLNTVSQ